MGETVTASTHCDVSFRGGCDVAVRGGCHVTDIRDSDVTNDPSNVPSNDKETVDNRIDAKDNLDNDDRLSTCSTLSEEEEEEEEAMGIEERPSSAMSCSSTKGSRIPRLCRSASVRHKNKSCYDEDNSYSKERNNNLPNLGSLQRSRSFATSRGMAGLMSATSTGNSTPRNKASYLTPELKRKKAPSYNPSYVSPYSMKVITNERKSQSFSGMFTPRNSCNTVGCHPHLPLSSSRRLSLPHVGPSLNSCNGSELSEVDNEDNMSEKSFSSTANSTHGCGERDKSQAGLWGGGRRPKNVLHCSHAHDQHDPDDYLTPTQRAARKIRELTSELRKARREISEKDSKISTLTRDLVELRIDKAERNNAMDDAEVVEESGFIRRNSKKTRTKHRLIKSHSSETKINDVVPSLATRSFSPSGDASCLSPPSDGSEPELRMLREASCPPEDMTSAGTVVKTPSSPAGVSLGDSDPGDLCRSLADSGHYEDQDLPSPCLSSRDSFDIGRSSTRKLRGSFCSETDDPERRLWVSAAADSVKENHVEEYQELKERHNDRVEMLLSKLSDSNLKYFELRPQLDKAVEQIRELERSNERLKDELHESELRQQKIYLQMYLKGQQAAKFEAEGKFSSTPSSRRDSEIEIEKALNEAEQSDKDTILNDTIVISLMRQLTQAEKEMEKLKTLYNDEVNRTQRSRSNSTFGLRREEIDPAITLQFLKSAIYYFLTDKENAQGHLRAIESILGYTSVERGQISKFVKM